MTVRSKEDKKLIFPVFYLCNTLEVKYLGHINTDDMSDDKDTKLSVS